MADLIKTLQAAGFTGESLRQAWAVAMRESGGNASAYNGNRGTGDDSHGLFQINMLGKMGADRDAKFRQYVNGYSGPDSLKDPVINARAAYYMTNKGTDWKHWDIDSSGYDGGSHASKYREWYNKFPGGNVATSTSSLSRSADDATQWAVGARSTYVNMCDRFVANAYGLPHSNYESAMAHWQATPGQFKSSDSEPPVGALVFWDTGKPAGHVAIVTGHDRKGNALVTTTHSNGGKPTVMTLASISGGMKYLGWSQPYFQGRTVELDQDSTGIYSSPNDANASDMSGVDNRTPEDLALAGSQLNSGIDPDKLSWKEMGDAYGYAESLLTSVPELKKIFKQAANQDFSDQQIIQQIKSSKWYKKNSEYARNTMLQQAVGGADWKVIQGNALQAVQMMATSTGSVLSRKAQDALVQRYMMEGWGKRPDGLAMMKEAMADSITIDEEGVGKGWLKGEAGNLQESLSVLAEANGVKLSSAYYEQAAQSVAKGLTTDEDWKHDIRTQAASSWPSYAEKIMAGVDVKELASAYVNSYANTYERDPDSVDLNDPMFKQALTRLDEKGNPNPVSLYEFENGLRARPEWKQTKNAQDKISSVAMDVARAFGFIG